MDWARSPPIVSCRTVEWRERRLPLSGTGDFPLACSSLLLGSKYLPCVGAKGQLHVNACLVTVAFLSHLPRPSYSWALPRAARRSQNPVLLVGPALLTRLFPPRKWVRGYQKPLTNTFFFFFNSFRRICFLQVQTRVARKSEQTRFLHLSFSSLETFLPLQADWKANGSM